MRRSPLIRKSPLRRKDGPAHEQGEHPKAKESTCAHCGSRFTPARPMQAVCGPVCARRKVDADKKAARESIRTRKEKIKTIPQLIAEAQREFNAWIRARDADKPCICCGRAATQVDGLGAHGWDAGHYRSTGSAPHLRYHEDNCHRQLVYCNRHGAGRAVDYRIGLIARIGLARVEALEADNAVRKWTREELTAIKNEFRAKRKELEKNKA